MLAFHDDPLIAAQHVLAGAPATHQELLGLIEGLVGVLEWLERENSELIIERDAAYYLRTPNLVAERRPRNPKSARPL